MEDAMLYTVPVHAFTPVDGWCKCVFYKWWDDGASVATVAVWLQDESDLPKLIEHCELSCPDSCWYTTGEHVARKYFRYDTFGRLEEVTVWLPEAASLRQYLSRRNAADSDHVYMEHPFE